jgi:hypothetical protein
MVKRILGPNLRSSCWSHVVNEFGDINIKKYISIPPNDVLNIYDLFTFCYDL